MPAEWDVHLVAPSAAEGSPEAAPAPTDEGWGGVHTRMWGWAPHVHGRVWVELEVRRRGWGRKGREKRGGRVRRARGKKGRAEGGMWAREKGEYL